MTPLEQKLELLKLSTMSQKLEQTLKEAAAKNLSFAATLEEILHRLGAVYRRVRENSGIEFAFDREDRQKHLNSDSFYLRYTGPLPAGSNAKVDITIREHVVFPVVERPVLCGYKEFADVPEDRLVRVCSLGEIAAEKTVALVDRARNHPCDLYDLWYVTSN